MNCPHTISCTTFNILAPIYKRLGGGLRESECSETWLSRNRSILDRLLHLKSSDMRILKRLWVCFPPTKTFNRSKKTDSRTSIKNYSDKYTLYEHGQSIYVDASTNKESKESATGVCVYFNDGVLVFCHKQKLTEDNSTNAERKAGLFGIDVARSFRFPSFKIFTDSHAAKKYVRDMSVLADYTPNTENGLVDLIGHYKKILDLDGEAHRIMIRQIVVKSEAAREHARKLMLKSSLIRPKIPTFDIQNLKSIWSCDEIFVVEDMGKQFEGLLFQKLLRCRIHRDIFNKVCKEIEYNSITESPHVANVRGVGYDHEEAMSIFLQFATKGSLADVLAKMVKIPESHIATIIFHVLQGLISLDLSFVTYINITPDNVLVCDDGTIKISDFGIVGMISHSLRAYKAMGYIHEKTVNNMRYMSPERLQSQSYDRSSHIWSLGVLALECAGNNPFQCANSYQEILHLHQEVPLRVSEDCSPVFCDFLSLCLQKNGRDRGTYQELLAHPFLEMAADLYLPLVPSPSRWTRPEPSG